MVPTAACLTPALQSVVASLLRAWAGWQRSWQRRGHEALDRSRSLSRLRSAPQQDGSPRRHLMRNGGCPTSGDIAGGVARMRVSGRRRVEEGCGEHGAQGCRALGELADPASALRISSEPGLAVCGATLCGLPALDGDGSADPDEGKRRTGAELAQEPRQLTGRLGGDGPSKFRQTTKMLEMASGRAVGRLAPSGSRGHHDGSRAHRTWCMAEGREGGSAAARGRNEGSPCGGAVFGKRQTWPK